MINLDQNTRRCSQIFAPGVLEQTQDVIANNRRFVYYTSADTALKVIGNAELWFRNATVMNDFREIAYGIELTVKVFSGDAGTKFREAADSIFPGTMKKVQANFSSWQDDWQFSTYIACVSLHELDEDLTGRLSMWRAYGNVALVVKNTPMTQVTDLLGVYSMPVQYLSEAELEAQLTSITEAMQMEKILLEKRGQDELVGNIHRMLQRFAIATKHPGFKEEKEWRLYYRPSEQISAAMTQETVVIGGAPQKVFKLRLAHEPEIGLFQADIPSLLDRIIVGPMRFPYEAKEAFVELLETMDVEDASAKVIVSDVPLRAS